LNFEKFMWQICCAAAGCGAAQYANEFAACIFTKLRASTQLLACRNVIINELYCAAFWLSQKQGAIGPSSQCQQHLFQIH
jgi:hypothetical protein